MATNSRESAAGALAGLRIFEERDIAPVVVATLNQSALALAQRLGLPAVVDPMDHAQIGGVLTDLMHVGVSGAVPTPTEACASLA